MSRQEDPAKKRLRILLQKLNADTDELVAANEHLRNQIVTLRSRIHNLEGQAENDRCEFLCLQRLCYQQFGQQQLSRRARTTSNLPQSPTYQLPSDVSRESVVNESLPPSSPSEDTKPSPVARLPGVALPEGSLVTVVGGHSLSGFKDKVYEIVKPAGTQFTWCRDTEKPNSDPIKKKTTSLLRCPTPTTPPRKRPRQDT